MRGGRRRTTALTIAAILLAGASARADVDARAQIGFGGQWVVEATTPVVLTLTNTGAETVDVSIAIGTGEHVQRRDQIVRREVRLAAGVSRVETFLVPGQSASGETNVELSVDPVVPLHAGTQTGDRGVLSFDVTNSTYLEENPYSSHVIAVTGDDKNLLSTKVTSLVSARRQRGEEPDERIAVVSLDPALLRVAPLGLDGLDTVVLLDPDEKTCAREDESDALLDWVAMGGRLVVSLGEHAAQFAATPLARELPAAWSVTRRGDYGAILESLRAPRITAPTTGPLVVLVQNALTKSPASEFEAERDLGAGRIVLLAYDLRIAARAAAPEGFAVLLRDVLAVKDPEKTDATVNQRGGGYFDVGGQVATTLRTGAFTPPPPVLVILGILLYVVVVGPLDWFVLKRLKRERLTTLTFAGAVVAFSLLAYGGSMLLFSSGARVNRIVFADLLDAGRDGRQLLRIVDVAGYYSPTGSDEDIAYPMPFSVKSSALPGISRGDELGSALPVLVASPDATHLRARVQLPFHSQRVVRAESVGTYGPGVEVEWDADPTSPGVRVTNGLPIDLDDVCLYVDRRHAYELGPAASGAATKGGSFVKQPTARSLGVASVPDGWGARRVVGPDAEPASLQHFLEAITLGRDVPSDGLLERGTVAALSKCGVVRGSALDRGHALLVAFARSSPVPLPGASTPGDTYFVLRREVSRP